MIFYNSIFILFFSIFSIFPGFSPHSQNPDYVPHQLIVKLKNNDKPLQTILKSLNINYKEIKRLHTIVPVIYKVKKDLKLEQNKRGEYLFSGMAYKNIDDIPEEELFKIAYDKMSEIEKKIHRTYIIIFPENIETEKIILQLKSNPNIESVDKNLIVRIQGN